MTPAELKVVTALHELCIEKGVKGKLLFRAVFDLQGKEMRYLEGRLEERNFFSGSKPHRLSTPPPPDTTMRPEHQDGMDSIIGGGLP